MMFKNYQKQWLSIAYDIHAIVVATAELGRHLSSMDVMRGI